MKKQTLHVVGLPHTATSAAHGQCAYTTKTLRFCKMMTNAGYDVIHYGNEGSEAVCKEHVQIFSKDDQVRTFGGELYASGAIYNVPWDETLWHEYNEKVAQAIEPRIVQKDLICILGGRAQAHLSNRFPHPQHQVVEYGIGYEGVFSRYRVFESYAWMHHVYGLLQQKDGFFFDAVVPNFFDVEDFEYRAVKGPDYLFMSRMTPRKGYETAIEMTGRLGAKLLVAGAGGDRPEHAHVQYVGYADLERRSKLMGNARAVLVPTNYIEPFGGVATEAAFCGTPVITTDWGAFTETVLHGKTGFRCRTLEQFVWAGAHAHEIMPNRCRKWAVDNYSLERVAEMYDEYFRMLGSLWEEGWYADRKRETLGWLEKRFPSSPSENHNEASAPRRISG